MVFAVSSEQALVAVKNGAATINASNYNFTGGLLTINSAYLAALANGNKTITIIMSAGADMVATITVAN